MARRVLGIVVVNESQKLDLAVVRVDEGSWPPYCYVEQNGTQPVMLRSNDRSISPTLLELDALYAKRMGLLFRTASAQSTEIRRAFWRNHAMEVPMFFHTLAEFVATILIMLIASGSVIGGMALYLKLRAKELEAQDSREAEARLRTVETRLDAMEGRDRRAGRRPRAAAGAAAPRRAGPHVADRRGGRERAAARAV